MKHTLKNYTTKSYKRYLKIYLILVFLLGMNIMLDFPILTLKESLMAVLISVFILFAFIMELIILVSAKLEKDLDKIDLRVTKTRDYVLSIDESNEAKEALGDAELLHQLREDLD